MAETFLRLPSVCERVDMSRGAIYDRLNPNSPRYDSTFPQPVKIGSQSVAWVESELDQWIAARIAQRDAELADAAKRQARAAAGKARASRLTSKVKA